MDLGLFLLHAVVGLFFVGHGAQKLFGALGGHGLEGTAGFFDSIGLKPGRLHATAAGLSEFGGGALLALGLLTPLGAALIVAPMAAAVATVHRGKGPWNADGGWELNVTYAVVAVALAGVGAGAWSLDAALDLNVSGTGWALGALGAGLLGGLGAVAQGRLAANRGGDTGAQASAA
jgi:putative oxidoreductase